MWSTDWLVVRPERVEAIIELFDGNMRDLRDECRHYASFADGDVEGSDLNRLWAMLQDEPVVGHICKEVFRDRGEERPKLGRVSAECVRTLAGMSERDIQTAAAAWQRTGIMVYGTADSAATIIRELKELSQRAISEGQVIVLEWWC